MTAKLSALAASPLFSYAAIVLLQLKMIWGMWLFRDLTVGDTSVYFARAHEWYRLGKVPIVWSPLYTSFLGSVLHLSSDAFYAVLLHRLIIVLALAILVLALMRGLLPPGLAWFTAAWWVGLPIDFNAVYEIHLFAVIPVLCAALLLLGRAGHWRRGAAQAVMLTATVLLRNELLPATVLLAAAMAGAAIWKRRVTVTMVWAYAVPLVGACLLVVYYYRHASDAEVLGPVMANKHTLNICQTYTFGYQQRNTDFQKSPWTECEELMTRDFGKPQVTLLEAFRRNPRAMSQHFLWNLELIPNGLQVALFNATSGNVTPDYLYVISGSKVALIVSFILLAIGGAGAARLARDWRHWWDGWLKDRAWGWFLLIAVGCVNVMVMITQRPRPSYIFALAILLRAAVGMCALALARPVWRQWFERWFPVLAVAVILVAPNFYDLVERPRSRPILEGYRRLTPFAGMLARPATVLMSGGHGAELCGYLAENRCVPEDYYSLREKASQDGGWTNLLNDHRVSLIYLNEAVLADPASQRLVSQAASSSWETLADERRSGQNWMLLASPGFASGGVR